jgi:NitT/TauT family transport system ATP-binding protein
MILAPATESVTGSTAGSMTDRAGQQPTLEIRHLDLTYTTATREVNAIRDLSLAIAPGEFVSIVGPSGCGKSSLLKIVYGLVAASAGAVHIGGTPVTGPRRDVGMVFQAPVLLPWRTILENVLLPADVLHLDQDATRQRALTLLHLVGLESFEHVYPDELSGGMQQRAGIVRALIHDPQLLLMDEPFAALDALTREQMALELQRIWMNSGKTVLFVTHSISEAVLLSDRIVLMSPRPGTIVDIFETPRERPRTFDDLTSPTLAALSKKIRHGLGHVDQHGGMLR